MLKGKPDWLKDVLSVVKKHIEDGTYKFTDHALEELGNDHLDFRDIMYVLTHGKHDESKTTFSTKHQCWNYAIVGKTIDALDVRVVVAFGGIMMIVTVFIQGKVKRKRKENGKK